MSWRERLARTKDHPVVMQSVARAAGKITRMLAYAEEGVRVGKTVSFAGRNAPNLYRMLSERMGDVELEVLEQDDRLVTFRKADGC